MYAVLKWFIMACLKKLTAALTPRILEAHPQTHFSSGNLGAGVLGHGLLGSKILNDDVILVI